MLRLVEAVAINPDAFQPVAAESWLEQRPETDANRDLVRQCFSRPTPHPGEENFRNLVDRSANALATGVTVP